MKRLNQKTGTFFKQGDHREDGLVFWSYVNTQTKADGTTREQWYSPLVFHRLRVKNVLRLAKARAKKENMNFNLSIDYMLDLFPKSGICPILGINMEWGSEDHASSPSMDKIIPELGYVVGNMAWISRKANALKNDATLEQLKAIVNYLQFHQDFKFKEAA